MKKALMLCILALLFVGIMVSCNLSYTAKSHKVTYNYNYGETPTSVTYLVWHKSAITPVTVERKGYELKGWCTDKDCTELFDFTTVITENITLYAKWSELGKGTAVVSGSTERTSCGYVQLWENGPKFAEFNVGSTISYYSDADDNPDTEKDSLYCADNVGGLYTWGGTNEFREDPYSDNDSNTGKSNLTGEADTATKLWGEKWRMPTKVEINTLINTCTWIWCDGKTTGGDYNRQYESGCTLSGWKVSGTGKYADNSIFLPAAGYCNGGVYEKGDAGYYWSSTSYCGSSSSLNFVSIDQSVGNDYRGSGCSVRAVLAE